MMLPSCPLTVVAQMTHLRPNRRRPVSKPGSPRPPVNGCVTGTHPPRLSVGGDPTFGLADNVSDAFRPHLGAVLAIPGNLAMLAGPERC